MGYNFVHWDYLEGLLWQGGIILCQLLDQDFGVPPRFFWKGEIGLVGILGVLAWGHGKRALFELRLPLIEGKGEAGEIGWSLFSKSKFPGKE